MPTGSGGGATGATDFELVRSGVARSAAGATPSAPAVAALAGFTGRTVARALGEAPGNLVCSPFSVALALGMTANGARGATQSELLHVLGDLTMADLDAGLAALTALVESRRGERRKADGNTAQIDIEVANSVWGQAGTAWEQGFLDELARWFDAGMHQVDFVAAAEAGRQRINAWTSERTRGKIVDLVPPGAIGALTRLVLVNAVYLKAPWELPFERHLTAAGPFTTAAGTTTVQFMRHALDGIPAGRGAGWTAATLPYAGRELGMTLVLPDEPTPSRWAPWLAGGGLAEVLAGLAPGSVHLTMPRWTFRTGLRMRGLLSALGMPTAFDEARADFSGMTRSERLLVDEVFHQGYVAVDEQGTEAAAATAVVMRVVAAPAQPLTLVLDRPFLFVVHDLATRAPLFVGVVADPSRTA